MVMGSSGLPSPLISCTIALPLEVTRNEACTALPSMSGAGGMVVTWASHEPAMVFNVSKEFCASDGGALASAAKAVATIRTNTTESAMRDFIMFSFSLSRYSCGNLFWRTRVQQKPLGWQGSLATPTSQVPHASYCD